MLFKHQAFTLAEVLITLGIIGVVAAITMPTIVAKAQDKVLTTQFKKAYNITSNLIQKTNSDLGYETECYIWLNNPYANQYNCNNSYNNANVCIKDVENGKNGIVMNDPNTPIPSDLWGRTSECTTFWNQATKNLKIVKTCNYGNAKNCISKDYAGYDEIKSKDFDSMSQENKDKFTDVEDYANQISAGCSSYKRSEILKRNAIVLSDGITIIGYGGTDYIIDINGKKGPNKWGYDVYVFRISGNVLGQRKITQGNCMAVEKGGYSTTDRIRMIGKK